MTTKFSDENETIFNYENSVYNIAPSFPLPQGQILSGYANLANVIKNAVRQGVKFVAIDGFGGVLWQALQENLAEALSSEKLNIKWIDTANYFKPEEVILQQIEPNLGGDDPIFGRLYEGALSDFFDFSQLRASLQELKAESAQVTIIFGVGAALVETPDLLLYVDVPKDEIQERMRAKTIVNLGATVPESSAAMYKRFYFVDWPALNRHKAYLLPAIEWFVDGRDPFRPTFIAGQDLRQGLDSMAENYLRVRPWFYPGVWGGQWMKQNFPGLPQNVPNYAWSFELIVPENGLVFANGEEQLECSFDMLMFQAHEAVLGLAAERFGYNFPIRFDYLDTMDGGNLSVQCHPRPEYILENFGEPFTQDESYYITTCKPGARVYLGFRNGVDSSEFRRELERSSKEETPLDIDNFVNSVAAHPHDLFLIPNGTIHGSGANNLVLEISSTPYIYTFKIYDWVRRDLSGKMRPINIERAWANLYFERQEAVVRQELCPVPQVLREGAGWKEVFVGTHPNIFYAVHRYEFEREIEARTDGRCHVLNVVEGEGVILETARGMSVRFNYGETFVVPAKAEAYRLRAVGNKVCKVVLAYVK